MKTILLNSMIMVFLSLCSGWLQGQTRVNKLDQAELIKQLAGTWHAEIGKDTIAVGVFNSFGNGLDGYSRIETKGKTIMDGRQLFGYDKKTDKIIEAEMTKNSDIELWVCWFTSEKVLIGVPFDDISNPEKSVFRVEVVIKSADLYVQTLFKNNKQLSTRTMRRQ